MTTGRSNSTLPPGITEADLIDLVDGVLAREREGAVLAALKQHPEVGLLAKQFRADRSLVIGLGELRAPSGLAEGIESRLEAAALCDLASQSREVPRPIPISQVQVHEPSMVRLLLESPWTRRLATAASLAIVVGLGIVGIRAALSNLPSKPVAHKDAPNPIPDLTDPLPAPTIDVAAKPSDETPASSTPAEAPTIIAAVTEPVREELSHARAAQLASEGRLAITVRATLAGPALKRLESLARARDTGWHTIALDAPAQYAGLLTPQIDAAPVKPTPNSPNPIDVAGTQNHPTPAAPSSGSTASTLPPARPVVKAIYTIEVTPGEQPFESLLRSISDALPDGAKITLRMLPQPIATPIAIDPDSVLWWTSPTSKWSRHARVPVVVEGLE
jgi:hypothetical protein